MDNFKNSIATAPLTGRGTNRIGGSDMDNGIKLPSLLDHTLLKAEASEKDLISMCDEAKKFGFATVAVNSANVRFVADQLKGSASGVCAAVGFPFGATCTSIKIAETGLAIEDGATDVDMVINIGALKSGKRDLVAEEIGRFAAAARDKALSKIILETCLLTEEEKIWVCECCAEKGVDFVKTSTGLQSGGATLEDIKLMKKTVGDRCRVKASGGIKSLDQALAFIEAGATRLGSSASVAIAEEWLARRGK